MKKYKYFLNHKYTNGFMIKNKTMVTMMILMNYQNNGNKKAMNLKKNYYLIMKKNIKKNLYTITINNSWKKMIIIKPRRDKQKNINNKIKIIKIKSRNYNLNFKIIIKMQIKYMKYFVTKVSKNNKN